MQEYVAAQNKQLELQSKKDTLSFNLLDRLKEVGLGALAERARPTEEELINLEKLAKAAKAKARAWIGSTEGEDLLKNFRPGFSRTDKILDVPVGKEFEDRMKSAIDARKSRTIKEKITFISFANFTAHLMH